MGNILVVRCDSRKYLSMCRSKRQQPLVSSLQLSQTEQDAANGNVAKRSKSPLANGAHSRVLPSDGMLLFFLGTISMSF